MEKSTVNQNDSETMSEQIQVGAENSVKVECKSQNQEMPTVEIMRKAIAKPLESFPMTDLGNARRLKYYFGDYLRYLSPAKKWLVWYGDRWKHEQSGEVMRFAKKIPQFIGFEVDAEPDKKKQNALRKFEQTSQSASSLYAMIKLLQTEAGIVITFDHLDKNSNMLNLKNGVIDIDTGMFCAHNPADLFTRQLSVDFDPVADCPQWKQFLETAMCGNVEVLEYLQDVLGYSMTEYTSERCLFVLYGEGRTGKSTFLNVWRSVMNDYAQNMAPQSLIAKKYPSAINNDIARLAGTRMVTAIETDSDQAFSEALVKQLTGGTDPVTARFLFAENFDFVPAAKIFIATNNIINIKGSDEAIWDRIRLIPFNVRVAETEQDKNLYEKLLKERAGIFNWAMEGLRRWQLRGTLTHPETMKQALMQYREEVDVVGTFLKCVCIKSPKSVLRAADIYNRFKQWCEESCVDPVSKSNFAGHLKKQNCTSKRGTGGVRMWQGIRFLEKNEMDSAVWLVEQKEIA